MSTGFEGARRNVKTMIIAAAAAAAIAMGITGAVLASARSGAAVAQRGGRGRAPIAYSGADGWGGGEARPPAIYIGGSDVFVRTPRWSRWAATSALAHGVLWVNTCSPTCAAGRYRRYPATVRLWGVARRRGAAYLSRLSVSYVHGGPRRYVYHWDVLPGATIPGWNGGPGPR